MKGVEIFSLRCFEAAVRLGSLSAAARSLGVSQPATTVQIAHLERRLETPLLVRSSRGVRPTRAGEDLLTRAKRILDEIDTLEGGLENTPVGGSLRVGATDVVVLHRLPPVLKAFRESYPEVNLELIIEGSLVLSQAVRAREIELALITLPVPDPPGHVRPLYRDRLCFAVAPGHPLARVKRITLARIAEASLLAHKEGSVTRNQIEGFFTSRGLVPRVAMAISSPEVLRRMARSGLGVAILSEVSIREEVRRKQLVVLRVPGWNLERISGLLQPPAGPASRAGRAFLELLDRSVRRSAGRSHRKLADRKTAQRASRPG